MRSSLVAGLGILLAGCKPAPLRLSDELDRSSSWLGSVAEVARTTAQNSTPIRFADDVIADASDELGKAASSLARMDVAPDIAREGRRLVLASTSRLDVLRADLDAGSVDMHGNIAWPSSAADSLSDLSERARKTKQ